MLSQYVRITFVQMKGQQFLEKNFRQQLHLVRLGARGKVCQQGARGQNGAMCEQRSDKSNIRTRPGQCGDVGHYEPREIAHQDRSPCTFKSLISSILVLPLIVLFSSCLALVPEHLSSNEITSSRIDVTWQTQCNLGNYEVTASNSQGANSSCYVGQWKTQATCEGLSPCREYNISVRACHAKARSYTYTNVGCISMEGYISAMTNPGK